MATSERFAIREVQVLSPALCSLSRLEGQVIAPGNIGTFDQAGQLILPSGNVGTLLSFPRGLKDYLYIDIEIYGGIASIAAVSPEGVFAVVGGVFDTYGGILVGTTRNSYTVRLPYCGEIDGLVFQTEDYKVRSIIVGFAVDGMIEARDVTKFGVTGTSVAPPWITGATMISVVLAPTQSAEASIAGAGLTDQIIGKLKIETFLASGMPIQTPKVMVYDGVNSLSYPTAISPLELCFSKVPNVGRVSITNDFTENVTIQLTPTVFTFPPLSTVYGTV